MKTNIIKIGTLLLFASLIIFFVMVKSGCKFSRITDEEVLEQMKTDKKYDWYVNMARIDTVKVYNKDSFAIVKEYIPSPKSAIMVEVSDIFYIFHEDSLPNKFNYSFSETIHPAILERWESVTKKKERWYRKGKYLYIPRIKVERDTSQLMNSSKSFRGNIFKVDWDTIEKDSL